MAKETTHQTAGIAALSRGGLGILICTILIFSPVTYASNPWIEMGKCVVDYTSWLPDCIENWIDSLISGSWSNGLEPEHPDVYLKKFTDSSEQDQIGSTIYRGFYADGNDKEDWDEKLEAWFDQNRTVVYIRGVMKDKTSRDNCTMEERDFEFANDSLFILTSAGWAKNRFDMAWSEYHS